jgi:SMODS and SLOG-associating 2TM effector domain family 5
MPELDIQPRLAPRIVSSIEQSVAGRRLPHGPQRASAPVSPADQLLHAMHTVKAARFNAAERLERKHLISVFALSMVSLYFVGLSVWQTVYAANLDAATNQLITLVSIMSSICTLVLALIDSMNDYKIKAHHMHTCALSVNDLLQELRLAQTSDPGVVQEFRRRYNEVVRGCPFNHTRTDYLMARAERNVPWETRAWTHVRYTVDVYGLYSACLIGPPLVLLLFR